MRTVPLAPALLYWSIRIRGRSVARKFNSMLMSLSIVDILGLRNIRSWSNSNASLRSGFLMIEVGLLCNLLVVRTIRSEFFL